MKLTGFRITACAATLILLTPAVAFAVSPFTDVIPGKFYESPVNWALDNGVKQTVRSLSCTAGQIPTFDGTNWDLKAFHCTNADCMTGDATTLHSVGSVGTHTSIAIGADTNLIISYRDSTNTALKVYQCTVGVSFN